MWPVVVDQGAEAAASPEVSRVSAEPGGGYLVSSRSVTETIGHSLGSVLTPEAHPELLGFCE